LIVVVDVVRKKRKEEVRKYKRNHIGNVIVRDVPVRSRPRKLGLLA